MPMDISQPVSSALMSKCQKFMIDSHEMKDGSLKIMYMEGILDDVVPESIRLTVGDAWFYTAACDPAGKTPGMMIPAISLFCQWTLAIDSLSKFTTPDHQGIF